MSNRAYGQDGASLFDRLLSAATYLTFGMAGFVWIILSLIIRKEPSQFLRYHIYQSLFFALTLWLVTTILTICFGLLGNIPFLYNFVKTIILFFTGTPIYFGFTLVHFTVLLFVAYLSLGALLGKYSYLPFISDVIGSNFRR